MICNSAEMFLSLDFFTNLHILMDNCNYFYCSHLPKELKLVFPSLLCPVNMQPALQGRRPGPRQKAGFPMAATLQMCLRRSSSSVCKCRSLVHLNQLCITPGEGTPQTLVHVPHAAGPAVVWGPEWLRFLL